MQITKKKDTCTPMSMGYGKRISYKVDIHITDSLGCTPEANTTSLINHTPIKNFLKRSQQKPTVNK